MNSSGIGRPRFRVRSPSVRLWTFLWAAGCLPSAGCAYTTGGDLPDHLARVRVPVFRNETTTRGLGVDLTRAVIEAFGADGRLRVAGSTADCLLQGRLVEYHRDPIREDRLDDVIEAQVTLVAEISFTDLKTGRERLVSRRVTNRTTDEASGIFRLRRREFERLARRRALDDLARNIVRATVELW